MSELLRSIDPEGYEDMPSHHPQALKALIGHALHSLCFNYKVILFDHEDEADLPPRREWLAEYIGDTLIRTEGGGGLRISVAIALQALNVHPPTPLLPTGLDAYGDRHELVDVAEFADWRPLLGRRIEGIDLIIGDWGTRKYGTGVLERGLQFRLEGGFSFIAAVESEAGALWLPGEAPERWRREIHSVTPIV